MGLFTIYDFHYYYSRTQRFLSKISNSTMLGHTQSRKAVPGPRHLQCLLKKQETEGEKERASKKNMERR